jgi:hypothetical protein
VKVLGAGSAAEAYFRAGVRMMRSGATTKLGSISSTIRTAYGWGHADRRARNMVVSEPHAAALS